MLSMLRPDDGSYDDMYCLKLANFKFSSAEATAYVIIYTVKVIDTWVGFKVNRNQV